MLPQGICRQALPRSRWWRLVPNATRTKHHAFTLVELIVTISVIAIVLALTLPAVQASREAARATACRNNLRNLGLAVIHFESNRSQYPGYSNSCVSSNPRSWIFAILPYVEQVALFDLWEESDMPSCTIEMAPPGIKCASDPGNTATTSTSYVANVGQIDGAPPNQGAVFPVSRSADFTGNGVFHRSIPAYGNETIVRTALKTVSLGDGASYTLLLSENVDGGHWAETDERWIGFAYHTADGLPGDESAPWPEQPLGINRKRGESQLFDTLNSCNGFARPSSYHPRGVNVVLCDGHVRFVRDTVGYGVYQAAMTPDGDVAKDAKTGLPLLPTSPGGTHAAMWKNNQALLE